MSVLDLDQQPDFVGDTAAWQRLRQTIDDGRVDEWNAWYEENGPVDLRGLRLQEIQLARIDLHAADLLGSQWHRCDLGGAKFSLTRLLMADLSESDFRGAMLAGASCSGVFAAGADFSRADLSNCDFSEAQLKRARLAGARLHGAQLIWCRGVSADELEQAHGNAATSIPEAMRRPQAWRADA